MLGASRDPVVIVGGGLVGMKSLEALAGAKREVHLVVSSDRVLSQMLDRRASDFFLETFRRHGVHVHLRADVAAFQGKKRLERVRLSDGSELGCALAVIGKGVRPNVGCLQGTGVALNEGIRVDDRMATSLPGVFAAGDVAEPLDVLQDVNLPSAIWPSAGEGGRIAGSNMAGVAARFSGAIRMNAVEILGVRAISAGDREGGEALTYLRPAAYRKLIVAEGRLRGYLLVGDIRGAGVLTALVKNRTEVAAAVLARDLGRGFSYRPRLYAVGGSIGTQGWGGTAR